MSYPLTRRAFLAFTPLAFAGWFPGARRAVAGRRQGVHPEPRPGIDARDVMTDEQLAGEDASVVAVFAMVREMPQIADGIHCYCGCAGTPGNRSLLTCYRPGAMARGCPICQGEARLAYRRWKEGQDLAQIRRAIDARFA